MKTVNSHKSIQSLLYQILQQGKSNNFGFIIMPYKLRDQIKRNKILTYLKRKLPCRSDDQCPHKAFWGKLFSFTTQLFKHFCGLISFLQKSLEDGQTKSKCLSRTSLCSTNNILSHKNITMTTWKNNTVHR